MKLAHYYSKSYTILLLDVCAAMFLIAIITLPAGMLPPGWIRAGIVLTGLYFIARAAVLFFAKREFGASITGLQTIISNFKKGRYSVEVNGDIKNDELGVIYRDLITTGNHINDIMSSQKTEINNLRELYNNIVLSISSYFLVTNDREEVIFANESFCKKFQFDIEEIIGKKIEDLFFFVTGRIKDSLRQIIETREAIVLEKTHILSKNRISVIGDVKLSSIEIKGENQILIVIDDITSKCRKDYQISLISQISETIQCDEEIDTILYTILTGVTSGSGLGFNRAALYLFSDPDQSLAGTMAVGPDTIEEAIEIWNSIQANEYRIAAPRERRDGPAAKGKRFLEKTLSARFDLDAENVFTRALKNMENIHIYDASRDERIDDVVRELMDVNEFVIIPLVAINRPIGIIVADNKFNQVPISNDSIELLSIFAFQAAISIEGYNNIVKLKREMQKIKERQEAMIESEKLAAVGRIAAHIAHEIRNPLVTMGGYAKRIVQQAQKAPKGETIARAAEVIIKESDRLEKTLSNVMDFTKPSTFIMKFNSVNEVIEDTCSLLHNSFQEKKIGVRLSLLPALPLVKSDFNQLKQVMLNLLQNAIDETPPAGAIEIASAVEAKRIAVYVRNEGSMILEESLSQIFDPFFTTKVTGVGLGLAIVKKIIADHGGEISVRNLPERGVEFKILLPLPGQ